MADLEDKVDQQDNNCLQAQVLDLQQKLTQLRKEFNTLREMLADDAK